MKRWKFYCIHGAGTSLCFTCNIVAKGYWTNCGLTLKNTNTRQCAGQLFWAQYAEAAVIATTIVSAYPYTSPLSSFALDGSYMKTMAGSCARSLNDTATMPFLCPPWQSLWSPKPGPAKPFILIAIVGRYFWTVILTLRSSQWVIEILTAVIVVFVARLRRCHVYILGLRRPSSCSASGVRKGFYISTIVINSYATCISDTYPQAAVIFRIWRIYSLALRTEFALFIMHSQIPLSYVRYSCRWRYHCYSKS